MTTCGLQTDGPSLTSSLSLSGGVLEPHSNRRLNKNKNICIRTVNSTLKHNIMNSNSMPEIVEFVIDFFKNSDKFTTSAARKGGGGEKAVNKKIAPRMSSFTL